jgi:electron transfer flavoprotein alpha subunit
MTIVLLSWGDTLEGGTAEALTLASRLAAAQSAELRWAVPAALEAAAAPLAASHGVQRLDVLDAAPKGADALVAVFAAYCAQHPADTVLVNQTVLARAVAPRLAARIGAAVVANVFELQPGGAGLLAQASAYGGDTQVEYELKAPRNVVSVVTTTLHDAPLATPVAVSTQRVSVEAGAARAGFEVVSAPVAQGQRLEDAEVIVSGGRGLGKKENFELVKQMADALGGMWGGSRAIVDDGWIDSSRQVGLTGKITRPGLYVAVGISGASQHMAGCSAAKTIIAINKDPDASIFRYARYGVVGDCVELLPELIRAARG